MSNLTVFNTNVVDHTKEVMFGGEALNISRFDVQRHNRFERLNRDMIAQYWVPEEIDMTQDAYDFKTRMDEGERHIFVSNLEYQSLLDSVQGRAPSIAFLPSCSLPELEGCIETWSFFEMIHSRSYTHIIRSVFDDPSKVFDDIMINEAIINRAKSVTDCYNDYINAFFSYQSGNPLGYTERDIKVKRFDAMVAVNVLEAIRFYVSFACSLGLDKQGKMRKSGRIITLIARDESRHKHLTQTIIRLWASGKDDPEMQEIYHERKEFAESLFIEAAQQEQEWAKYLFSKGSIRGLNEKILSMYVDYLSHHAMKAIGVTPYCEAPSHPIPWIESYFKSSSRQDAPQDTEETSYLVGNTNDKITDDDLESFKNMMR